ncbi:helix-turn-helix transcriptional regulator [Actinacidiphila rubida]|nr:helix-turn-helix domain-containing protein [Actinacidiphila rubida]
MPALLNTREVARLLRVDPSSVRRWRAERPPQGPPFIRLSQRVVLYDAAEVRQWLNKHHSTQAPQRKGA